MATTKKQTRKYWYKYAKNLLTSSGITYLFVGEDFNKIKTAEFPISNMSDNETANVLKLLESSPSEAEREMVRAFILKRSAAELKQKQIFIWDMDSFFTFLPQQHADQISFNHMTEQSLEKLVKNGFKSDASCNLVNIKDAQIDEEKDKLRVVRNVYEQNKDPTGYYKINN
uniref:Type I site-specific deoxyribonuclease n=1 Tax=Meloidogyne hapla TaxID=6305 RepID=A0A1I8BYT9_MELHA